MKVLNPQGLGCKTLVLQLHMGDPGFFVSAAVGIMLQFLSCRRHRVALRLIAIALAWGYVAVSVARVVCCSQLLVCSLCQLKQSTHDSQHTATARRPPVPWPVVALRCCKKILMVHSRSACL